MEEKMKKIVAGLLLVVLCAAVVFACCACTFDDSIIIEFDNTMGQKLQAVIEASLVKFNKIYPDIKVTFKPRTFQYPQLYTNISGELNQNDGPSMAYCYPDHVAGYLVKRRGNMVIAMDDYINSAEKVPVGKFGNTEEQPIGLDKTVFYEQFYNENYKAFGDDSPMYMLPFAKSSEVIYYDKTFFTKYNLELPTHWWCDETCEPDCATSMEKVCARIREIDSNCIPLGYDSEANLFITLCEQYQTLPGNEDKELYTSVDGQHYKFDNEITRGFMERLNQWYANKYFTTSALYGNYTSGLFTSADATRCYMCIGSTGGASYQSPKSDKFTVDVAQIPYIKGGELRVIAQGPSLVMLRNKNNSTADHQLATWLFLKFIATDPETQSQFSMVSGYAPVIKSLKESDPVYQLYLQGATEGTNNDERIMALATNACLNQTDAYYVSAAFNGSTEARAQIETLVANILPMTVTSSKTIAQQIEETFAHQVSVCESYGASGK